MRTQTAVRIGLRLGLMIGVMTMTGLQAYAQDAKAIFTKAAAIYTSAKTYQATYNSVVTTGAQGTMNMKMDMKMNQSKQMNIKMAMSGGMLGASTMNSQLISDGKFAYTYIGMLNGYTKTAVSKSGSATGFGISPMDFKAGKGIYKMLPAATVGGKPCYIVEYTPEGTTNKTTFAIAKSNYHYVQFKTMTQRSGQPINVTVDVKKEMFNAPLPASTFVFTPPKGAKEMKGGGMGGLGGGAGMGG